MKRTLYALLPVTAAILVAAWLVIPGPAIDDDQGVTNGPPLPADNSNSRAPIPLNDSYREELSEEQLAMLADPRILRFSQRLEFEEELRTFLENHQSLATTERDRKADDIRRELAKLSEERQISQQEKLLVEIALLQATIEDEDRQREAANDLIERYRDASRDQLDQWAEQRRPQLETYKEAESRIVREVMARDDFPDDASRQRYLERRLREARQDAYGP